MLKLTVTIKKKFVFVYGQQALYPMFGLLLNKWECFYKTRKFKEKKKKKKTKKNRLAPWVADPHVASSTNETDTPPISDMCPTIVNLVFCCIKENWWTLYFLSHRSPEDEWFIGKYNPLQFYLIFSFICLIY